VALISAAIAVKQDLGLKTQDHYPLVGNMRVHTKQRVKREKNKVIPRVAKITHNEEELLQAALASNVQELVDKMKTEGNVTKAGAGWYDWWWKAHDKHVKYTQIRGATTREMERLVGT
jgi:hypothetical protein